MSQYGDINVMVNWCTRQKVGNVWQNFVILLMDSSCESCSRVVVLDIGEWDLKL
jgi:hypothetical protein